MARKGIREYDAKRLLGSILPGYGSELALVGPGEDLETIAKGAPWLSEKQLVVKPDQLFGKRGKHGLIGVNLSLKEAAAWISERMNKEVTVGGITDKLTHFLVEPFVPHERECYIALRTELEKDIIYMSNKGGVDIEENWDSVTGVEFPEGKGLCPKEVEARVIELYPNGDKQVIIDFIIKLHDFFVTNHFTYLEINPFTLVDGKIFPLDTVAKVDDTAAYECRNTWGGLTFPPAFGRTFTEEEAFIEEIDSKTGASLKLSVLKPDARIWTMVAGGGASVIFADTISDLGFGDELANYDEYSGDPSTEHTYYYARTILDLMTRKKDPKGREKILIIGGGIANFTDVAKTFTGIIQALTEYQQKLKDTNVRIYVRRGGPNYKQGLERMTKLGSELDIPIHVYGPETHMTNVVSLALGPGE